MYAQNKLGREKAVIYLSFILLSGISMAYGNELCTVGQMVDAWYRFTTSITDWESFVKPYEPRKTGCGIVYELPNFLNRPNEDLAIVDMRRILFAEPHYHPEGVTELYIVLQGTGLVVIGDDEYYVSPGDVALIPPLTGHYTIPDKDFVIAVINTPPYTPEHYIPLPSWQGKMNNKLTLQSYESGLSLYMAKTPAVVSGVMQHWIDTTLALLHPNARIVELGSAFGRDAAYIEKQGFKVERTDAAQSFVTLLQQHGYPAHLFNVLTDNFEGLYDLIFANAVFLHFTPTELSQVLEKIHTHLTQKSVLSFSVKAGTGEQWETAKLEAPRYFCFWTLETLAQLLRETGFEIIESYAVDPFMCIIARKI